MTPKQMEEFGIEVDTPHQTKVRRLDRWYQYQKGPDGMTLWDEPMILYVKVRGPVFRYRYDSVPGIRRRRSHRGDWYRYPRTTQEVRWNEAYEGFTRGSRSKKNLPNAWDDIQRSYAHSWEHVSWKNFRKGKQWQKGVDLSPQVSYKYLSVCE